MTETCFERGLDADGWLSDGLTASIQTSAVRLVDLRNLALDLSRPGRLVALENLQRGDAVMSVVNKPRSLKQAAADDH